jgi:hypothetical protein
MHFNQATLMNDFMTPIQSTMNNFPINPPQINNDNEIEAIDQQFNEVLKFLAQSIDSGNKPSNNNNNQNGLDSASSGSGSGSPQLSSPSPLSLSISTTTTPNSDLANMNSTDLSLLAVNHHHHIQSKQNDRASGGSINSNNSSGLGDEFYSNESSSISTKHSTSKLEETIHNLKVMQEMKNISESTFGDSMKKNDLRNKNKNATISNMANKSSISSSKVISNINDEKSNNININNINDPRVVIRNVRFFNLVCVFPINYFILSSNRINLKLKLIKQN